jgi:hypothetical protein
MVAAPRPMSGLDRGVCHALRRVMPCQSRAVPHQSRAVPHQSRAVPHQSGAVPHQSGAVDDRSGRVPEQSRSMPDQPRSVRDQSGAPSRQSGSTPRHADSWTSGAIDPDAAETAFTGNFSYPTPSVRHEGAPVDSSRPGHLRSLDQCDSLTPLSDHMLPDRSSGCSPRSAAPGTPPDLHRRRP